MTPEEFERQGQAILGELHSIQAGHAKLAAGIAAREEACEAVISASAHRLFEQRAAFFDSCVATVREARADGFGIDELITAYGETRGHSPHVTALFTAIDRGMSKTEYLETDDIDAWLTKHSPDRDLPDSGEEQSGE